MNQRFFAAFLSAVFLLSGCHTGLHYDLMSFNAFKPGKVEGAKELNPFEPPEAHPSEPFLSFFALGCAGAGNEGQRIVAQSMGRTADKYKVDFTLYLGDNFYGRGVRSTEDPQWQTKFENIYTYESLEFPFYAVLGNHDHYRNPDAQVEYTKKSKRWRMPARYYTFEHRLEDGTLIQFFGLDTNMLLYGKADDQLIWLMGELEKSEADWKVVYGHHPLYSGAYTYKDQIAFLRAMLEPLLIKYGVNVYLSAHNHSIEIFEDVADVYYIISGAGSRPRDVAWINNTSFAGADLGFVWLRFFADKFEIMAVGRNADVTFSSVVKKDQPLSDPA